MPRRERWTNKWVGLVPQFILHLSPNEQTFSTNKYRNFRHATEAESERMGIETNVRTHISTENKCQHLFEGKGAHTQNQKCTNN